MKQCEQNEFPIPPLCDDLPAFALELCGRQFTTPACIPEAAMAKSRARTASKRQERRAAKREPALLNLELSESTCDSEPSNGSDQQPGRGRMRNISELGICFLSSMRLRPGPIRVREAGRSDEDADVELEIVRSTKVNDLLWEYGAASCSGDDAAAYELPAQEFRRLMAAVRAGRATSEGADNKRVQERQLVLSLREVANWRSDLQHKSKVVRRQFNALSAAKAFLMFTAVFLLAQSAWAEPARLWWGPALATGVALIYVAEWRLAERLGRLHSFSFDAD